MIQQAEIPQNLEKIIFKDYFTGLHDDDARSNLRDVFVPKYISYSSFYRKINDNSFSELEFEKLEQITNKKFER